MTEIGDKENMANKKLIENQKFSKAERLCSKIGIEKVFAEGKSLFEYPLKLIWVEDNFNGEFPAKVGISVSKRLFKRAVKRNLLKRRIREAFRKNKFTLYNYLTAENKKIILFIIYTTKEIIDYKTIENKMKLLMTKFCKQTFNT